MRVLHVTAYCSAFSQGGTERYVDSLITSLTSKHGVENHILVITPKGDGKISAGITSLYPKSRKHENVAAFRAECRIVLNDFKPDWLFIHTSDVMEVEVARLAVERKIPYIFFYHAQSWFCAHYDMRYCCKEVCHRLFSPWRCSVCMASGKGGRMLKGAVGVLAGEAWRILHRRKESWLNSFRYELPRKEYIVRNANKVVVFTEQDKGIMQENGIDHAKLTVIPQGIAVEQLPQLKANAATARSGCLKVGYIGRATQIKGCHILVDAVKLLPKNSVFELHIYGCDDTTYYVRKLKSRADGDTRIIFHPLMSAEEVLKAYAKLDILCIPSIVFETGPLTLFEGIYSGCKVYASNQIGQMQTLLKYGTCVQENTPSAWAEVFQECIINLLQIRNSRRESFDCRTMETVADEIVNLLSVNE